MNFSFSQPHVVPEQYITKRRGAHEKHQSDGSSRRATKKDEGHGEKVTQSGRPEKNDQVDKTEHNDENSDTESEEDLPLIKVREEKVSACFL